MRPSHSAPITRQYLVKGRRKKDGTYPAPQRRWHLEVRARASGGQRPEVLLSKGGFRHQKDALAYYQEWLRQDPRIAEENTFVLDHLRRWVERADLKPSTRSSYRHVIEAKLAPHLDGWLAAISPRATSPTSCIPRCSITAATTADHCRDDQCSTTRRC